MPTRTRARPVPASDRRRAPPPYMSATALRRWRRAQRDPRTGKRATLLQAAEWWGVTQRTWQYWEQGPEKGGNRVPRPLQRVIERGYALFAK